MTELAYKETNNSSNKKEIIKVLLDRDGDACYYCGFIGSYTIDHYIPRSLGGSNSISNLRLACLLCNQSKNMYTCEEWAKRITVQVDKQKVKLETAKKLLKRVRSLAQRDVDLT